MICYGIHPVLEAFAAGKTPQAIIMEGGKERNPGLQSICRVAAERGVPVEQVPGLNRLCGEVLHQGVAADIDDRLFAGDFQACLAAPRVVMLDGIADPHNFGAALRVCEVFGFRDVIFHKGDSCGVTPAVVKVSAGAVFHLNVCEANLNKAVAALLRAGHAVYALEAAGDKTIWQLEPAAKYTVVVGSEAKGVRFNIQRQASAVVSIPMQGRVSSLNVSCALTAMLTACSRPC